MSGGSTDNDLDMKLKLMEANINGYTQGLKDASNTKQESCEDVVSREDIEECKELMTDINGDTVYAVRMSCIRQLPPVKPPTCDTCEYNTAAFMPCNACKDKSEYKRKEIKV